MSTRVVIGTVVVLLTAGLLGCGGEPAHEVVDDGTICFGDRLYADDRDEHLPAGESFEITVFVAECLSGCRHDTVPADCSVDVDGETLTVSSYGGWSEKSSMLPRTCTDMCVEYRTSCEVPALEEGTYRVEHGDNIYEMEVPGGEGERSCLDEDDEV